MYENEKYDETYKIIKDEFDYAINSITIEKGLKNV